MAGKEIKGLRSVDMLNWMYMKGKETHLKARFHSRDASTYHSPRAFGMLWGEVRFTSFSMKKLRITKKFTGSLPLQGGAEDSCTATELSSLTSMGMMLPTNRSQVALFNHQKPGALQSY